VGAISITTTSSITTGDAPTVSVVPTGAASGTLTTPPQIGTLSLGGTSGSTSDALATPAAATIPLGGISGSTAGAALIGVIAPVGGTSGSAADSLTLPTAAAIPIGAASGTTASAAPIGGIAPVGGISSTTARTVTAPVVIATDSTSITTSDGVPIPARARDSPTSGATTGIPTVLTVPTGGASSSTADGLTPDLGIPIVVVRTITNTSRTHTVQNTSRSRSLTNATPKRSVDTP